MSMPGTTAEKDQLVYQALSCAYCHTYERIVKSRHTAEEFIPVIQRMRTYYQDGTAQGRGDRGRGALQSAETLEQLKQNPIQSWGGVSVTDLAQYLATVNLSGGKTTWPYELKTLPRPTGEATRVIITQWDMPRRSTVSHDMDMDSQGIFWYTDESLMYFGKLDPTTNEFTEYPLPPVPEGDIPGARDIQIDRDDNPWFAMRIPGSETILAKFDRATEELSTIEGTGGQFLSLGPDGKIWIGDFAQSIRVNPATMEVDGEFRWQDSPNLPPGPHASYAGLTGINSEGDPYLTDFVGSYIIGIDVDTGEAQFYETPTRNSMPRRARMDAQDRFWFAEYFGDKIGVLDTRSKEFQEWPVPHKYTTPYTVTRPDKNGFVYASSNMSERLLRLNPETGEVIEYQIPTDFDSKKIAHDPSTDRVTLWMANTRNARLLKVEPLE
jgi:streptogramin lyase